jgi:2,4-dienoyl-CoA reductase-like NADH-dependent reductase (Old Yellow Enzyme family)
MTMTSVLFQPLTIGKVDVAGRVFKAATSETRASIDGFVTDELIAFYEPIARARTPLVLTGNLYVSKSGKSTYRMCGIDDDDKIDGLRRWASAVRSHGSAFFAQLNHCGRQTYPHVVGIPEALSASDVREKVMGTTPRAMTHAEIARTVDDFAAAAGRAKAAGFDGVQIHLGHGYLLSQFLTPYTNRRRDQYGGSPANRMRFPREVLRAVRARVGGDYPVIAKINGADLLPGRRGLETPELVEVARALEGEGLDAIEITVGHYESGFPMIRGRFDDFFDVILNEGAGRNMPAMRLRAARLVAPMAARAANAMWPPSEGFNLPYARQFKAALRIPVICVGGFQSREGMERAILSGACDAVSVARAMVADPLLYQHLRDGEVGPKCDFSNGCIARAGSLPVDCYNRGLRAEREAMLAADAIRRNVPRA